MKRSDFTVLLVDDEIYALHLLEELLSKRPHIGKIEKATRKIQALELAFSLKPDIIFQDIRMGDVSGIDMVDEYRKLNLASEIVFVTAYEQYAIEAIRKQAFDYLLKPVDPDELDAMLLRLRARVNGPAKESQSVGEKLKMPTRSGYMLTDIKDIVFCEASGNYTNITMRDGSKVMSSGNLGKICSSLQGNAFIRLNRSVLANADFLVEVNKGKRTCVLKAENKEYFFSVSSSKLKELDDSD